MRAMAFFDDDDAPTGGHFGGVGVAEQSFVFARMGGDDGFQREERLNLGVQGDDVERVGVQDKFWSQVLGLDGGEQRF